ncbi:MAG TPA: hypothetical protein VLT57_02885 [Bryobacteraceae bacterium]|nr:hypothetical protein [Bryobacteraceae bacterium]
MADPGLRVLVDDQPLFAEAADQELTAAPIDPRRIGERVGEENFAADGQVVREDTARRADPRFRRGRREQPDERQQLGGEAVVPQVRAAAGYRNAGAHNEPRQACQPAGLGHDIAVKEDQRVPARVAGSQILHGVVGKPGRLNQAGRPAGLRRPQRIANGREPGFAAGFRGKDHQDLESHALRNEVRSLTSKGAEHIQGWIICGTGCVVPLHYDRNVHSPASLRTSYSAAQAGRTRPENLWKNSGKFHPQNWRSY